MSEHNSGSSSDGGGDLWSRVVSAAPSDVEPWLENPTKQVLTVLFGALVGGILEITRMLTDLVVWAFYGDASSEISVSTLLPTIASDAGELIATPITTLADVVESVNGIVLSITGGLPVVIGVPLAVGLWLGIVAIAWIVTSALVNLVLGFFGLPELSSPLGPFSRLLEVVR